MDLDGIGQGLLLEKLAALFLEGDFFDIGLVEATMASGSTERREFAIVSPAADGGHVDVQDLRRLSKGESLIFASLGMFLGGHLGSFVFGEKLYIKFRYFLRLNVQLYLVLIYEGFCG